MTTQHNKGGNESTRAHTRHTRKRTHPASINGFCPGVHNVLAPGVPLAGRALCVELGRPGSALDRSLRLRALGQRRCRRRRCRLHVHGFHFVISLVPRVSLLSNLVALLSQTLAPKWAHTRWRFRTLHSSLAPWCPTFLSACFSVCCPLCTTRWLRDRILTVCSVLGWIHRDDEGDHEDDAGWRGHRRALHLCVSQCEGIVEDVPGAHPQQGAGRISATTLSNPSSPAMRYHAR
jgi:hypothetical protein